MWQCDLGNNVLLPYQESSATGLFLFFSFLVIKKCEGLKKNGYVKIKLKKSKILPQVGSSIYNMCSLRYRGNYLCNFI